MGRSLEPQNFPHIVEQILEQVDYKTLLAARKVSRSMSGMANRLLIGDKIAIKRKRRGCGLSFEGPKGNLPFFHPGSRIPWHKEAMQRAQQVSIAENLPRSYRLNGLLMNLPPTCQVQIRHSKENQPFRLSEIASLEVVITDGHCNCRNRWAAPVQHAARRVTIIIDQGLPVNCQLGRSILNPATEHLEIRSSDFQALCSGTFVARVNYPKHPRHPDLKLVLHLRCWVGRHWNAWQPTGHQPEVVERFASHFDINESQVSYRTSKVKLE